MYKVFLQISINLRWDDLIYLKLICTTAMGFFFYPNLKIKRLHKTYVQLWVMYTREPDSSSPSTASSWYQSTWGPMENDIPHLTAVLNKACLLDQKIIRIWGTELRLHFILEKFKVLKLVCTCNIIAIIIQISRNRFLFTPKPVRTLI